MDMSVRKTFTSERRLDLDRFLPAIGLLVGIALWTLVTTVTEGVIQQFHPVASADALARLLSEPSFYEHIWISLYRFALALGLSIAIGLPIGVLVGFFTSAERATTLLFQFMRMISPLAWFPIAIIIFGVGTGAAVFVMVMAGLWPIILNTAHGISTIEDDWTTVAESLGGDTPRVIRYVVVPGALPDMLTGLRLSVGILWIILVPAEMLGVNSGLGYYVLDARDRFAYAEIPAVMIIIGIIGYSLDLVLRLLLKRWSW